MASLADYYSPPSGPPAGFSLAGLQTQQSQALEEGGIQQSRIMRNFSEYDLPDLINNQAAKGTFFSGTTGVKADRLRQGATDSFGDIGRTVSRTVANLASQGVLAASGIQI